MIANYHTHTARCGHALGEDREYAEAAYRAGLKILGFSDHTPHCYLDGSTGRRIIRMHPDELPGYAASVRSLAEEYRGRLDILLGVEAEYYPALFARTVEMLRENGVEYLILGQHFLGNELDEPYCGRATDDPAILNRYVEQSIAGLRTGLFSCFAHPDLIRFTGDEALYDTQMRRLCRAAKETDTPLEINLLGLREGRHYPNERFWRIAGEEGNTVILGFDAHEPEQLLDPAYEREALRLAHRCGIEPIEKLTIRRI